MNTQAIILEVIEVSGVIKGYCKNRDSPSEPNIVVNKAQNKKLCFNVVKIVFLCYNIDYSKKLSLSGGIGRHPGLKT